ncbi:hypothetical protein PFHG_05566 [Plasmodium falciparum HB3]|uniref:Small EDRK-rich factor-like N-terminal domain-containing protein n=1 Tax=Plasmodium falciparum (isolate HB3) TaxID=137071 RepID=A0A0L7KMF3_PLAFX|nr:hypothetical protein PFHG_05566 [Plasmodium falciparum HB3]
MGKGSNACKRNQARERKNVEVKGGKSQLKANKEALNVTCKVKKKKEKKKDHIIKIGLNNSYKI